MTVFDRTERICKQILKKTKDIPEIAIVLGSGLGAFAETISRELELDYRDIKGFPVSTVPGHEGKLIFGTVSGKRIVAMQGRFHLYEGYSTDEVTLPIRVFQRLGVKTLILTNAAGAVNEAFRPGDLMIIEDHISFFCPSPLRGRNDDRLGPRFFPMTDAYDKELREVAKKAASECGTDIKSGVYCYCQGPMFETPAEIRMLSKLSCDAVGMSTVPEAIVAAHGGLRLLGISCLTNMAAGLSDTAPSHEEVIETGKSVEKKFSSLMEKILELI